jgi:hypothetical protein
MAEVIKISGKAEFAKTNLAEENTMTGFSKSLTNLVLDPRLMIEVGWKKWSPMFL